MEWDDENPTAPTGDVGPAPELVTPRSPTASPSTPRTSRSPSPDEPAKTVTISKRQWRVARKTLSALVLVAAIGGAGFILGHDIVKPTPIRAAAPKFTFPTFPSGGFGNSPSFQFPSVTPQLPAARLTPPSRASAYSRKRLRSLLPHPGISSAADRATPMSDPRTRARSLRVEVFALVRRLYRFCRSPRHLGQPSPLVRLAQTFYELAASAIDFPPTSQDRHTRRPKWLPKKLLFSLVMMRRRKRSARRWTSCAR